MGHTSHSYFHSGIQVSLDLFLCSYSYILYIKIKQKHGGKDVLSDDEQLQSGLNIWPKQRPTQPHT